MTSTQTAEQIAEAAAALIEQLGRTARTETRTDMAYELDKLAKSPAAIIVDCMKADRRPVTDELRAGLALAAELLADLDFG